MMISYGKKDMECSKQLWVEGNGIPQIVEGRGSIERNTEEKF